MLSIATVALLGCLTTLFLSGCDGDPPHPEPHPIHIDTLPHPNPDSLLEVREAARVAGEHVSSAGDHVSELIESDEGQALGCDLLTEAVDGHLSTDPDSIQDFLVRHLQARVLPGVPEERVRQELETLSSALNEADSENQALAEIAVNVACL